MSEWLSMPKAAAHLCYDGPTASSAVYQYLRKKLVPMRRVGNRCLVLKADVDLAVNGHNFAASRARAMQKAGR